MLKKSQKGNPSPSPSPPPKRPTDDVVPSFSNIVKTTTTSHTKPPPHPPAAAQPPPPPDYLFDNACVLDMDYFVKTISGIKSKGVRPDLVGSIIAHYSSKWLPDLSPSFNSSTTTTITNHYKPTTNSDDQSSSSSTTTTTPETMTSVLNKKRFFVETIVKILPPEPTSVPCNFLLRLLRVANTVNADPATCRTELEGRIACLLDQAELSELMIPSFSHTCGTLLDIDLVIRLVRRFLMTATGSGGPESVCGGSRSGAAVVKVARLVDSYLAEAAVDASLGLAEFIDLAGTLPAHARTSDDGLYRAIDTYLKAHPNVTKQERKLLCRLIDSRKLSSEASLHASQNDRLPVRAVVQVLFSEQSKLARHLDWSGLIGTRSSPSPVTVTSSSGHLLHNGFDQLPTRSMSKREAVILTQQSEIRKLKEDLLRLQSQCNTMQGQMEKLHITNKHDHKKKNGDSSNNKPGFFTKWRKIGMIPSFRNHNAIGDVVTNNSDYSSSNLKLDDDYFCGSRDRHQGEIDNVNGHIGSQGTPMEAKSNPVKGRRTPKRWRRSTS